VEVIGEWLFWIVSIGGLTITIILEVIDYNKNKEKYNER